PDCHPEKPVGVPFKVNVCNAPSHSEDCGGPLPGAAASHRPTVNTVAVASIVRKSRFRSADKIKRWLESNSSFAYHTAISMKRYEATTDAATANPGHATVSTTSTVSKIAQPAA